MHLQPHQLLVWVAGGRLLQRVRAKIKFFGSAFSISLGKWNLPEWLICEKLQSYIASFEALGQLLLLLGRVRGIKSPAHHVLHMRQLCDNAAVAPLAFVLQAISYHAVAHGVQLTSAHCAGERNGWAVDLSRGKASGFNPLLRVEFNLMEILAEPWAFCGALLSGDCYWCPLFSSRLPPCS